MMNFKFTRVIAGACLLTQMLPMLARGNSLVPGADLSDCASALWAGPRNCASSDKSRAGDERSFSRGESAAGASLLDRQVDEFLANYGKPPREAVRALLDPSDANIRAMLHAQEQSLAIASYVATRMNEMQASGHEESRTRVLLTGAQLASLSHVRVVLALEAQDHDSGAAVGALSALARSAPLVQARVELVGDLDARQRRAEMARELAPLDVVVAAPTSIDAPALPYVRIDDLHGHRMRIMPARGLDYANLVQAVLDLCQSAGGAQSAAGTATGDRSSRDSPP